MSRFYAAPECVREDRIYVTGEEVRHIVRVMRLGPGDDVVCFDGTGREYHGTIESASPQEVRVKIRQTRIVSGQEQAEVTLAQAVPRKEKMEYVVQKATELGVNVIIPLRTSRTVVEIPEKRKAGKLQRWRKIALEAAKQCGRTVLPVIEEPVGFGDLLDRTKDYDLALIGSFSPEAVTVREAAGEKKINRALLLVGPEGGFSPEEEKAAGVAGCIPVALSRWVLRADTAAVAALAILREQLDFRRR